MYSRIKVHTDEYKYTVNMCINMYLSINNSETYQRHVNKEAMKHTLELLTHTHLYTFTYTYSTTHMYIYTKIHIHMYMAICVHV